MRFILPKHYSGRRPNLCKAFGWYRKKSLDYDDLVAVCTFGKPASPFVCVGICGKEWKDNVYELNRLCRVDDWKEPLSQFVSACLRRLRVENWIVVSYADTAMNHHGYIYQACNFLYTGCTDERTDKYTENGKHARHYDNSKQNGKRVVRSAKHRYVFFCTYNTRMKKLWRGGLRYSVLPYPKGDNSEDYPLGTFLEPVVVQDDKSKRPEESKEEQWQFFSSD